MCTKARVDIIAAAETLMRLQLAQAARKTALCTALALCTWYFLPWLDCFHDWDLTIELLRDRWAAVRRARQREPLKHLRVNSSRAQSPRPVVTRIGTQMAATRKVDVHVTFSDTVREDNNRTCSIEYDSSDSIWDVKSRIAVRRIVLLCCNLQRLQFRPSPSSVTRSTVTHYPLTLQTAFGGSLTADNIFLYFGPNDRKIGRQFAGDPNVDEKKVTLEKFSVLSWLDRFPQWHLGAKLMPPAPPPPGVAIKKAAALAEGRDADKAVQEARAKASETTKLCRNECQQGTIDSGFRFCALSARTRRHPPMACREAAVCCWVLMLSECSRI